MHRQQRPQGGVPVSLDLLKTHRSLKWLARYRNELLRDLVADDARTRRKRFRDKAVGAPGFIGSFEVKRVDENVRVEEVPSGAHSSLRV